MRCCAIRTNAPHTISWDEIIAAANNSGRLPIGRSDSGSQAADGARSDLHGFSDFFSSLFGGTGLGGESAQPEVDAGHLDITVEEMFTGTKRRVLLQEGGHPRQVDVQIPSGVADGQSLRISGIGGRQSLIFRIKVRPHSLYSVSARMCRSSCRWPLGAALGATRDSTDTRRVGGFNGARRRSGGSEIALAWTRHTGEPIRRSVRRHQSDDAAGAKRRRSGKRTSA